jgi:hypothetical protein
MDMKTELDVEEMIKRIDGEVKKVRGKIVSGGSKKNIQCST